MDKSVNQPDIEITQTSNDETPEYNKMIHSINQPDIEIMRTSDDETLEDNEIENSINQQDIEKTQKSWENYEAPGNQTRTHPGCNRRN